MMWIQWSMKELGITLRFERKGFDEVAVLESIEGDKAQAQKVGQTIVKIDPWYFSPTKVETLLGDPSNPKAKLEAWNNSSASVPENGRK